MFPSPFHSWQLRRNRSSSGGHILDNGDGPSRVHERRPLDLTQIQDRQAVALFIRELLGRQRHLVLARMAPELPHRVDADGIPEVHLRVDDTSLLLYVLHCVFATLTLRPQVVLALVWTATHFQRLLA